MKRTVAIFLALLVASALAVAGYVFLLAEPAVTNDGPGQSKIAATPDDAQAQAILRARETDLPALAGATRVIIETVPPEESEPVERSGPEAIEPLRAALQPREVPPSGGMRAYRLRFFRGEEPIRNVWVYGGGEWGFERPGGTSWTIGSDPELVRVIRSLLAETATSKPARE